MPLQEFETAIREVDKGKLDKHVNVIAEDEIGFVAHAFNNMLDKIHTAEDNLRKQANTLKLRVEERSNKLVQAEKMASLGRMVGGIAHEINTPVGIGITASSHLNNKLKNFMQKYEFSTATRGDFDHLFAAMKGASLIIKENLERAANLISTFKIVAADQNIDETRKINLYDYIDRSILSLKSLMTGYNIKVSKLGGSINVISEKDKGTVFIIHIKTNASSAT